MPRYILTYHGGTRPATPEDGKAQMARWNDWVANLGEALLEPQNPVGKTMTIDANGAREGSGNPMNGYSVLEAADVDAAVEIAKACPFAEMGSIEVSQIMQMG